MSTTTSTTMLQALRGRIAAERNISAVSVAPASWSEQDNGLFEATTVVASSSGNRSYNLKMRFQSGRVWFNCSCPDWQMRGRHAVPPKPCKHLLAWLNVSQPPVPIDRCTWGGEGSDGGEAVADGEAEPIPPFSWTVSRAIQQAIAALADLIGEVLAAGRVPFLIGPTGCGKTSANRLLATRNGWRYVEHAGSDAWSDSDLVGIVHVNGERFPGPIAQACQHAQNGRVHLLLDEFTRYNRRVQDALMRFILPTPVATAKAMGIPARGDIYITSAPFWGDCWAEKENLTICLAANPWGTDIDPALIRRVEPVRVGFDKGVSALFEENLRQAVEVSWSACNEGNLALPIEYQLLSEAKDPADWGIVARYISRLAVCDPSGAEGYVGVLEGMGIVDRKTLQEMGAAGLPGKE